MATRYQLAKDYLNQGIRIDQQIKTKIEQAHNCRELTNKASVTLSGMPRNPHPSYMDDFISKAIDLEEQIAAEIQRLIELKADITLVISRVATSELRWLLELRYLCFRNWDMIAIEMFCDVRHVYRLHENALREVDAILRNR